MNATLAERYHSEKNVYESRERLRNFVKEKSSKVY